MILPPLEPHGMPSAFQDLQLTGQMVAGGIRRELAEESVARRFRALLRDLRLVNSIFGAWGGR